MNLLVKKLKVPVVVLLASLFFVSCEDPGKIGLNINPKNGDIITKYKEFVLPSTQVQFDPRSTLNSISLQAGVYTDSDFGIITSKSYMWLGVQSTVPTLSESAAYVNTTISIQFSSIYGSEAEMNEIESFEVYQLADEIEPGVDYTRVDEIALGSLIGNLEILIQEKIDTLATDSLFTFTLSDEFGQAMFDKLATNDGTYNDDTVFNAFFKGIAIVSSSGNNKIIQFNTATFSVKLNYSEINSAQETVERTYSFNLGSIRFFHLSSDVSGTPLAGILPDNKEFIPSDDYRYLQSGTMIAIKVDYDSILTFFDEVKVSDSINSIIIQKAFLTVGDIPINKPGASFPFSLIGYFTDETNTWPALAESSTDSTSVYATLQNEFTAFNAPSYPGYYGNTQTILTGPVDTLTYEATMSNFIQNLIDEGYNTTETPLEQNGDLILYTPTGASEPQSSPSHTVTNFFKVHKDSIRLKIYYSIPNL